jgi:broad specificity phosphatase PhoE
VADETTELYLIRHGESVPNVTPIIGGMRGDAGLTGRGREQAQLLEKRLREEELHADQLYASTLPRALETAEYVARALDLRVQPDDELHELRPGEADGLTVNHPGSRDDRRTARSRRHHDQLHHVLDDGPGHRRIALLLPSAAILVRWLLRTW